MAILLLVLFGDLFIISLVSLLGLLSPFALARRYGETFVKAFVSQETYDKYIGYLDKNNGKSYAMILGAAFALPGFPDDFLCMVSWTFKDVI